MTTSSMTRRVVVTGLGVVSPVGNSIDTFFSSLIEGRSGIKRIEANFIDQLDVKIAAQAQFKGEDHFTKQELALLDRVSQFAVFAARQAAQDAKIDFTNIDLKRASSFIGTGMGGASATEEGYNRLFRENANRLKPFTVLNAMNGAAGSHVAMQYQFLGSNLTYSTACSSSNIAIGEAYRNIKHGYSDVAFAGGSEALLTFGTIKAWEALRTLADEDSGDLSRSSKPFSLNRSGLVLGEGAGMLILEEMDSAIKRGAHIYAEIKGYGTMNDVYHITQPSVDGQSQAMIAALHDAKLKPQDIHYINAHGTATKFNDLMETQSIKKVFSDHAYKIPVSSTKSMHGHLMGATGAVESIASILAIKHKKLPPTMHLDQPDPECDLDYVPNEAREISKIDHVMCNTFAFGGTGGVLIFGRV